MSNKLKESNISNKHTIGLKTVGRQTSWLFTTKSGALTTRPRCLPMWGEFPSGGKWSFLCYALSFKHLSNDFHMLIVFTLDIDKNKTKTKQEIKRQTKHIMFSNGISWFINNTRYMPLLREDFDRAIILRFARLCSLHLRAISGVSNDKFYISVCLLSWYNLFDEIKKTQLPSTALEKGLCRAHCFHGKPTRCNYFKSNSSTLIQGCWWCVTG